jgi:hypothetical protein
MARFDPLARAPPTMPTGTAPDRLPKVFSYEHLSNSIAFG